MRSQFVTALTYTLVTTAIFGIAYPYAVTGASQLLFRDKANGQLLLRQDGTVVGSRIIGQPFTGPSYFHSRPSAAGNGYDASSSGGSNLGPTNKKLRDRIAASVASEQESSSAEVPVDLVTASGSGLDPDITPASAAFQIPRISQARRLDQGVLRGLVAKHTQGRQFGVLGEPRVNVLELNLELDQIYKRPQ